MAPVGTSGADAGAVVELKRKEMAIVSWQTIASNYSTVSSRRVRRALPMFRVID